eukprot:9432060-Pyramimonas_sp.AAC.1
MGDVTDGWKDEGERGARMPRAGWAEFRVIFGAMMTSTWPTEVDYPGGSARTVRDDGGQGEEMQRPMAQTMTKSDPSMQLKRWTT